jgi:hypothetical protein
MFAKPKCDDLLSVDNYNTTMTPCIARDSYVSACPSSRQVKVVHAANAHYSNFDLTKPTTVKVNMWYLYWRCECKKRDDVESYIYYSVSKAVVNIRVLVLQLKQSGKKDDKYRMMN